MSGTMRWTVANAGRVLRSTLSAVVLLSAAILAGCGEESSNGSLCERCGVNFGNCQPSVTIEVDSETNAPSFCSVPPPEAPPIPCTMELRCLSEIENEAVRRCYPANPSNDEVDPVYRCDGARPLLPP